jgi:hypothetical protein
MVMKLGTVAVCSKGCLGLITAEQQQKVTYRKCDRCRNVSGALSICTCDTGMAYVGIHLSNKIAPIGSPWSSRNPRVIGHIDQLFKDNVVFLQQAIRYLQK